MNVTGKPVYHTPFRALRPRFVLAVALFLFVARLGVALLIDANASVNKNVDIYVAIAENLANGNGFVAEPGGAPIMHRPPLYPVFLSAIYLTIDEEDRARAVLIAQALLDAVTALLVWWIGFQLFNGGVGISAAVLFVLYPLSAYYTLRFLPESLFTMFLIASMAVLIHANRSGRLLQFAAAGGLAALATLVKPAAIGLIPFVAVLLLVKHRRAMAWMMPRVGVLVAVFVLLVAPWTVRNYLVSGHFVPVSTGVGTTLWVGNNRISDGREDDEIQDEARLAKFIERRREIASRLAEAVENPADNIFDPKMPKPGEPIDITMSDSAPVNIGPTIDKLYARAGLDEIVSSPLEALSLFVRKFFRLWFDIYLPENRWAQPIIYFSQSVLLLLAGCGALFAWRSGISTLPLVAPIMYFSLVYTLLVSTLRYSIPLLPIVVLLGTAGLFELASRFNARSATLTRDTGTGSSGRGPG